MKNSSLYLDYNATTPLKPQVRALMHDIFSDIGNASSVHGFGRAARGRIEYAREQVASLAGVFSNQVIFTSGATESNNTVLKHFSGQRVFVSAIEHSSVLESVPDVQKIPVTKEGIIDMATFEALLHNGPPPALISIMLVNNETGVIQPVAEMARLAKKIHPGVFIHTDAVQAAGRIPIDFPALHVDYLSLSAHKMGGPQGVGTLIVAPGASSAVLLHGGGQEKRQRAGTENVAGIAGFGLAAELAVKDMAAFQKLATWRDRLEAALKAAAPEAVFFGQTAPRVANTSNIALPGAPAEMQLMALDLEGIAVSSGSACSSGTIKPSHVLLAMSADSGLAASALRISLGWSTTESEVARLIGVWTQMRNRIKNDREKK